MNQPEYQFKAGPHFEFFEFYSEGPKGRIRKAVAYQGTDVEKVYNLAFGDFDEEKQIIDDLSVTNNGDSRKVLATVASTIYAFAEQHPGAWILATGSTAARNRLYRMGISNHINEISLIFIYLATQMKMGGNCLSTALNMKLF